jgi:kynurenine formamidase
MALMRAGVVDLSHPLHEGMPFFPGRNVRPFERFQTAVLAEHGVGSGRISMSEHQGTHLDAPCHFIEGAGSVEAVPAAELVADAVVIDIAEAAAADPDHRLDVAEVEAWESRYGPVPDGAWVLIHTGWAARWEDAARYVNADADGRPHHPACSPEAAALLVARGIRGVGIDTLSVDNAAPSEVRSPTHKVLHGAGRLVLENLANLDRLPSTGVLLVIGALPIVGGTGGPARVLAFVDQGVGS